jgi:histidinol-phosphate/aromatic aminotransferase/cobyric acid decarboxylase-like protein
MSTFKAITTVYSYYMPEVRDLITDLAREYPHEVFLRSISPGLDDFHHPIIEKLVVAHQSDVPQLSQFSYRYPTAGSEEGIREYLTLLQSKNVRQIYMWEGEYEGYRDVARTRNIDTVTINYEVDPATLPPGHWFLSNPSARNGMIVPEKKVQAILDAGHKVFYDLSYLDATLPYVFDVEHPNINAVVISFSKPYGLFYYRIGFTFCREIIPALYANKWFKNVYGLLVAERILDKLDRAAMVEKYKAIQTIIVGQINQMFELGLSVSDTFLLAKLASSTTGKLSSETKEMIGRFQREEWYRFCLTPYFMEHEKE